MSTTTENMNETIEFSRQSIADLGTLLSSILAQSEKGTAAHSLAGIGTYVADEYGAMVESMQADLQENIKVKG
tara:strand:+ start:1731 stop:1949 length:219 start_codon:yes stop_codon:yes gene_type:complete